MAHAALAFQDILGKLFLHDCLDGEIDREAERLERLGFEPVVEVCLDAGNTDLSQSDTADDVRGEIALRVVTLPGRQKIETRNAEPVDAKFLL